MEERLLPSFNPKVRDIQTGEVFGDKKDYLITERSLLF